MLILDIDAQARQEGAESKKSIKCKENTCEEADQHGGFKIAGTHRV